MKGICMIGMLLCFTMLHAQYRELTNTVSDPNHKVGTLPTFFDKDSAKGSPYLVRGWLRGTLDLTDHKQLPEPGHSLFFNYDKLRERLVATDGISKIWAFSNDSISRFSLVDSNTVYNFEKVPWISRTHFLQMLVKSEKGYSLYKRITTRVVAADYRNEGYYTTGRKFDQYTDTYEYYLVYPGHLNFRKLNLNTRAVRKALGAESSRLNTFFSQHSGSLDEHLFIVMIQLLNEQH